jgi:hypothetical protein
MVWEALSKWHGSDSPVVKSMTSATGGLSAEELAEARAVWQEADHRLQEQGAKQTHWIKSWRGVASTSATPAVSSGERQLRDRSDSEVAMNGDRLQDGECNDTDGHSSGSGCGNSGGCCFVCRRSDLSLFRCSACRAVQYCCVGCQASHWNTHQRVCSALSMPTRTPAAATRKGHELRFGK